MASAYTAQQRKASVVLLPYLPNSVCVTEPVTFNFWTLVWNTPCRCCTTCAMPITMPRNNYVQRQQPE